MLQWTSSWCRGRRGFKMYIPSKPGKYGIKLWLMCDVETSYCSNLEVYCGKTGHSAEIGQEGRVVMQMTEHLKNSGRNVTGDNFFSSIFFSNALLSNNLTYVGTVRQNKRFLPPVITSKCGREELSSKFAFQSNTTLVSYTPKKRKTGCPDVDTTSQCRSI